MSDWSQGPGWWQASDGKWYPPESAPHPPPPPGPGVPFPAAQVPSSGEGPSANKKAPWYDKTWVLVLSLLVCFPLGLILVWTNKRFTQQTKIGITGAVLALAVVGGIASAASPPEEAKEASATTTTEQPTTTAAPTTTMVPTTAAPTTTKPPTTTTAPPQTTTTPPPPEASLTPSQEQAVRAAQSYLDMSGFSRQGLIDQLSSEYGNQFSVQDATVAVESLTVDWNAEAVESAKSYLEMSGFSCQGLIDQLSSEFGNKFTVDQATYAAKDVGLC